jgi:predicted  nucleic acid-binding Zn ribbon protein
VAPMSVRSGGRVTDMVTVGCPWCDAPAVVEMMADEARFRCDDCDVVAEVVPDVRVEVAAAA